eukprot:1160663-Pelagomonas_calceolata.AAC.4
MLRGRRGWPRSTHWQARKEDARFGDTGPNMLVMLRARCGNHYARQVHKAWQLLRKTRGH